MDAREQIRAQFRRGEEEERLQALKGLAAAGAEHDLQTVYLALGDVSWRVRKEAAEVFLALPRVGDLAGEVIELLHSDDNAGLRNTAVEILVSLGRQAIPSLLEELPCSDHDVRKFVLDILGQIGDASAVPAMIRSLADADGNVRAAAAENLGKIGSPAAVSALVDALQEPDLLFRFTVLEALGQIGTRIPVERLLLFQREPLLRKALFDCLGRIGDEEALPALVQGLTDRMRNVREAAALAVARLGDRHPKVAADCLSRHADAAVGDNMVELLENLRPEVRQAAVRILGWLADGRFAPRLLALFEDEELRDEAVVALIKLGSSAAGPLIALWPEVDSRTRSCLAYVFGQVECDSGRRLLLEAVHDADPQLRLLAAQSLGQIGDAAAIAPLMQTLADEAEEVRATAMRALTLLSNRYPRETLQILTPLLDHSDAEQRMYAVTALAGLAGEEVERHLALAMKDESPLVRRAAVRAFDGRLGGDQISVLILALTDEDTEVRKLAAELLGGTGDAQALAPLGLARQDDDPWVRTAAVRSLGRLGSSGGEALVVAALGDAVGLVVIAALETLAEHDFPRYSVQIAGALEHPDAEVVSAALQLLAAGGDQEWIPPMRWKLLNHPHWEVRKTFTRILQEQCAAACRPWLEERLLVEGEDLVRQQILDALRLLPERRL
ncbi:MAG: HEAT repeat domain-containing protein [Desulfuromonadales bacterium]|nr:HEAT repeat domain-containing protein [Desulfuromonadales bacterium]